MNEAPSLGVWLRRFLLEHLVGERNLARNTQRSYRDTLVLLLPFVAAKLSKALDQLTPTDLSAEVVRLFLTHLEESRQSSIATRNQRLAALHAVLFSTLLNDPGQNVLSPDASTDLSGLVQWSLRRSLSGPRTDTSGTVELQHWPGQDPLGTDIGSAPV